MKKYLKTLFWSLISVVLLSSCKDGQEAAMPWKDQMRMHGQDLAADIIDTLDSCQSIFYDNGVGFLIAAVILMAIFYICLEFDEIGGFWGLFIIWNLYVICTLAYFGFSLPTASGGADLPWLIKIPAGLGVLVMPFFQYYMTIMFLTGVHDDCYDGEDVTSKLIGWQVKLSIWMFIPILFCMMWVENKVDMWYYIYFGVQALMIIIIGIRSIINQTFKSFIIYLICACVYIPALVLTIWYVTVLAIIPAIILVFVAMAPFSGGRLHKEYSNVVDDYGHTVDTVDGSNRSVYDGTQYNKDDMGNLYR